MSSAPAPRMLEIDLSKLSIQELNNYKQQIEQELQLFQDSLQTMKMAQGKFQDSKQSIEKSQYFKNNQPILVPLTSSMYVDGEVVDVDSYIISVGTGYYIRKNAKEAIAYFQRRLKYVTDQIELIQSIGMERSRAKEAITSIIQSKIQSTTTQLAANSK